MFVTFMLHVRKEGRLLARIRPVHAKRAARPTANGALAQLFCQTWMRQSARQ
jgi:hypothetical protein